MASLTVIVLMHINAIAAYRHHCRAFTSPIRLREAKSGAACTVQQIALFILDFRVV